MIKLFRFFLGSLLIFLLSLASDAQTFNPAFVGSIADQHFLTEPYRIKIAGNYAYVLSISALEIFDITVPTTPTLKGRLANGVGGAMLATPTGIDISGNYAYIVSNSSNTLEIVDISNPAAPVHKSSLKNGDGGAMLSIPYSVDVSGSYAYIASFGSNALEIVDISNPASPVHKASIVSGTNGAMLDQAFRVSVVGNYAYVASWGNFPTVSSAFEIVDISNPSSPLHVGSLSLTNVVGVGLNSPHDLVISGNYAYIACEHGNDLEVIDISNPTVPVLTGRLTNGTNGALLQNPLGLSLVGNYAFVTTGGGTLEVIDISNPTAPAHKSSLSSNELGSSRTEYCITISGNYAFVVNYANSLEVIDVSNVAATTYIARITDNATNGPLLQVPNSVFTFGNYAYVTSQINTDLEVIDVSIPTEPVHKGGLSGLPSNDVSTLYVSGNFVYLVNPSVGLEIIDISNPAIPLKRGNITNGSGGASLAYPTSVFVSGSYAYVGDGGGALEIIDVSNPDAPVHKGILTDGTGGASLNYPSSVFISGNYAYVTDEGNGALEIVNISNPAAPIHKGSLANGVGGAKLVLPSAIFVSGNYAYVADGGSAALEIVDVSNPAAPVHKSSLVNGSGGAIIGYSNSIFVNGNYAYLCNKGLEIVDVTNPAMPVHYSNIEYNNGNPYSIYIQGNYGYVLDVTNNSLEVLSLYSLPAVVATAATNITQTSFQANWNAVAGATGYQIDISADNFSTFVSGYNNASAGNVTSVVVSGLSGGTTYQYRVYAVDPAGISSSSNIISVTTLPKNDQVITFSALPAQTLGAPNFTLIATSNSGLSVSYSSSDPTIASVSGNTVSLLKAGSVTITASQAGDAVTNAATPVQQTFCVNPSKPIITVSGAGTTTPTLTSSSAAGDQWYLNGSAISGATGATLSVTQAGTYAVNVTIDGCQSVNSDNSVIVITGVEASSEVLVYPTIVKDYLYISNPDSSPITAMIVDMTGKVILSDYSSDEGLSRLDLSSVSSGLYLLRLQGRNLTTTKFIKE